MYISICTKEIIISISFRGLILRYLKYFCFFLDISSFCLIKTPSLRAFPSNFNPSQATYSLQFWRLSNLKIETGGKNLSIYLSIHLSIYIISFFLSFVLSFFSFFPSFFLSYPINLIKSDQIQSNLIQSSSLFIYLSIYPSIYVST